jgi:Protein of unknown function (DUF2800)
VSGTHSILAPSDSARWLRCVGALYLSRGVSDPDKEHSASGTCSHWLLQWQLENPTLDLDSWLGKEMEFGENPPFKFKIDEERLERVRSCVRVINREPGDMLVEHKLDTTPVLGVPNQEGHSDIIKLYPEGGAVIREQLYQGVLSVHDYKDGYLLVNAKDNTQGLIYLCAAMIEFSLIGNFNAFRFCIHQPKLNHYDEWTYTRFELETFMALIRPVAKLAYDVYHETVPFDPQLHLVAGEEQCTYCEVRGRCVARAKRIMSMFEPLVKRHELDDKSLGIVYAQLDEISAAITDFRAEALRRAKLGVIVDGQKLIYGNKGKRVWTDKDKAESFMQMLAHIDKIYEPREIISPTQANKILKRDVYDALVEQGLVTQSDPQLHLVPLDHKGAAVTPIQFIPTQEPGLI